MRNILLILLGLLPAAMARAGGETHHYEARLDRSEWLVASRANGCYLAHPIPRFGTAVFSLDAERNLSLRIWADWPAASSGMAELHLRPAHWRRGETLHVQNTRYQADGEAFSFSHYTSKRILNALDEGQVPALRFTDWFGERPVEVALSPVRFRAAGQRFARCVTQRLTAEPGAYGGLADLIRGLPVTQASAGAAPPAPDRGRTSAEPASSASQDAPAGSTIATSGDGLLVYFASDSPGLNREAMTQLQQLADRLRREADWQRVVIDGHADYRGTRRYNDVLGRRRAEQVKAYLVAMGLPADRLSLRSYGETRPARAGTDPASLAENRRVAVQIEREQPWEKVQREHRLGQRELLLLLSGDDA